MFRTEGFLPVDQDDVDYLYDTTAIAIAELLAAYQERNGQLQDRNGQLQDRNGQLQDHKELCTFTSLSSFTYKIADLTVLMDFLRRIWPMKAMNMRS